MSVNGPEATVDAHDQTLPPPKRLHAVLHFIRTPKGFTPMLIVSDRRRIRRGGASWIIRIPLSQWEIRWQRAGCTVVAEKP